MALPWILVQRIRSLNPIHPLSSSPLLHRFPSITIKRTLRHLRSSITRAEPLISPPVKPSALSLNGGTLAETREAGAYPFPLAYTVSFLAFFAPSLGSDKELWGLRFYGLRTASPPGSEPRRCYTLAGEDVTTGTPTLTTESTLTLARIPSKAGGTSSHLSVPRNRTSRDGHASRSRRHRKDRAQMTAERGRPALKWRRSRSSAEARRSTRRSRASRS